MDIKEIFVDRTHEMYGTNGEVTISAYVGEFEIRQECTITFNAHELLRDIPHLHYFAKKAIEEERQGTNKIYREMLRDLQQDLKRPVGRPKKD